MKLLDLELLEEVFYQASVKNMESTTTADSDFVFVLELEQIITNFCQQFSIFDDVMM
jgi:hypothetical protein